MVYEQKIVIPEEVKVELQDGGNIEVSKEGASVSRIFVHPHVTCNISDSTIVISTESKRNQDRAVVGTWTSHINNLIKGVTSGFTYSLKIVYTHFPMNVSVNGDVVDIKNFLGAKGILKANILGETKVVVKKEDVIVSGTNREDVGQTAANIEKACKVKGKDRRVFQDGVYLVTKE
ncbi:MAG: 50S ribosomal protein L6 [Candidatus Aenigmarchaeota archaeon]|nr:50S ribosomal protein L6 [Candidatus Aenigmarchaeota archaeon]